MGAGAYICGEEGALISSCEGLPGEPKTRPPYPATRGYLGYPTIVNNVETFCHAARILDRGPEWFFSMGVERSHGTKLFSVSGDCLNPGPLRACPTVTRCGASGHGGREDAAAVLVGGPSGTMIARDTFHRRSTFDDLATGGAIIVFNGDRNILEIVEYYMSFFVHESCGYCTPCRVGNVFLQKAVAKFRKGLANPEDIDYLRTSRHDHRDQPLRPWHDLAQPDPVDAGELPAGLFGHGQTVRGRHPRNLRHPVGHRRGPQDRQATVLHLRQDFTK
jgi:[NiFe] hydrogenase diaphorase moiety large subunit